MIASTTQRPGSSSEAGVKPAARAGLRSSDGPPPEGSLLRDVPAGGFPRAESLLPQSLPPGSLLPESSAPGSWLHVVSHLDPKYGGLSAVVPQLCSSIAEADGTAMALHAFCSPEERYSPVIDPRVSLHYWPNGRVKWLTDRSLKARLEESIRNADGVHIHGLWDQSTEVAARLARQLGKPYLVSAHGMLERWALKNKKWKKRIYAALVERANIEGAACLHALTEAEAADYRRFGSRRPIVVIPNGVSIPDAATPEEFFLKYPELEGKRILLFLGRLHPKKGLDLLVSAWAGLAHQFPDARLVLAGPDSEGTRGKLEQLARQSGTASSITFTGMLDSTLKWSALAAADGFTLPSYSEGLSVSTLEAMGMGLPVIITEQCNLPEVVACGAGWQIQPDIKELKQSISEFLNNPSERNLQIGRNGRQLVQEKYSWPEVGSRMSEVYRWLGTGVLPEKVQVRF